MGVHHSHCGQQHRVQWNSVNLQLWDAAQRGDAVCVKRACAHPAFDPKSALDGVSALAIAIRNDHGECVRVLLQRGAKCRYPASWRSGARPNGFTMGDCSPLHLAVLLGAHTVVRTMLSRFPQSCCPDRPAYVAHLPMLERYVAHRTQSIGYVRPMALAACMGHVDVLRVLARAKASVNRRSHCGFSPLHSAVFHGRAAAAIALVRLKADVGATCRVHELAHEALMWLPSDRGRDTSAHRLIHHCRRRSSLDGIAAQPATSVDVATTTALVLRLQQM